MTPTRLSHHAAVLSARTLISGGKFDGSLLSQVSRIPRSQERRRSHPQERSPRNARQLHRLRCLRLPHWQVLRITPNLALHTCRDKQSSRNLAELCYSPLLHSESLNPVIPSPTAPIPTLDPSCPPLQCLPTSPRSLLIIALPSLRTPPPCHSEHSEESENTDYDQPCFHTANLDPPPRSWPQSRNPGFSPLTRVDMSHIVPSPLMGEG